ncbi:transmembrane protease serine 6-like [Actinia tenebrosa]|uniref:Transmembrane protease serine 6-like n=1 Tax=Actinia tenebrosa TaxID=6105 RepID=A0A6P8I5N3_ACTTE|nr:transmembrane protease serine 6-like [Actinia tenebrosa]
MLSHLIDKRIVGGAESQFGEWPWQVALMLDAHQVCAGSLINDQWVLSAGHCFMDPRSSADPNRWTVLLGERSRTVGIGHFERKRHVQRLIVHPRFKGVLVNGEYDRPLDYDLALLQLDYPIKFDAKVFPICLPSTNIDLSPGKRCYISGWGRNGWKGTRAKNLKQAAVPLVSRDQCNNKESYNGQVHKTSLCAGFEDGAADACQSDSGGPLSCENRGRWYLAGVISWGRRCGRPHKYGVYANVRVLRPWIIKTIQTIDKQ